MDEDIEFEQALLIEEFEKKIPVSVVIDSLLGLLLKLKEGYQYDLKRLKITLTKDIFGLKQYENEDIDPIDSSDWLIIEYYMSIITIIHDEGYFYLTGDNEKDDSLNKLIREIAPKISFISDEIYIITDNLFYRNLDDVERAILYLNLRWARWDSKSIPLPEEYVTDDFLKYLGSFYNVEEDNKYFLLKNPVLPELLSIIALLKCGDISLNEAISRLPHNNGYYESKNQGFKYKRPIKATSYLKRH